MPALQQAGGRRHQPHAPPSFLPKALVDKPRPPHGLRHLLAPVQHRHQPIYTQLSSSTIINAAVTSCCSFLIIVTMGSDNGDTFANRDTPIPVVQLHPADNGTPTTVLTPQNGSSSHRLSATKLKDKLESLGDNTPRESFSSRTGDKMFNL